MLPAFRSLWITRNRESLCKYRSPCAIPSIIARRLFQSIKALLVSSAKSVRIGVLKKNTLTGRVNEPRFYQYNVGARSNTKNEEI